MKSKIKLVFKNLSEIVGNKDIGLISLTDEAEERELLITCDREILMQLSMRLHPVPPVSKMLPEVLWQIIDTQTNLRFEIIIDDIIDGQYRVLLYNIDTLQPTVIRASDAVWLSYISKIPIYIETSLMNRQSFPYKREANGASLPINILDDKMIDEALDKAIRDENYELASRIRDEIKRRKEKRK